MDIHEDRGKSTPTVFKDRSWDDYIKKQAIFAFRETGVSYDNDLAIWETCVPPLITCRRCLWTGICNGPIQDTAPAILERRLWVAKSKISQRRSSVANIGEVEICTRLLDDHVSLQCTKILSVPLDLHCRSSACRRHTQDLQLAVAECSMTTLLKQRKQYPA